jgi:hypothetical protein
MDVHASLMVLIRSLWMGIKMRHLSGLAEVPFFLPSP